MENSASSPDNKISISNAVHRFVVIGPQTEDLLKESDLLGKNAEVVYSADNVNQWDIETAVSYTHLRSPRDLSTSRMPSSA